MNNLIETNVNVIANKEQYIQKFLEYIDVSDNTLQEYVIGLRRFFNYCAQNGVQQVERTTILNYREDLKEQGKEASTINLYLSSVKSFFKWLEYEGLYKDITRNIKAIPVETGHKREAFTIEQIRQLLSVCSNLKEKLIISLATSTGLRCNELRNVRVQDFVDRNGTICLYVLGKARQGMRTDYVVVSNQLYQEVQQYINEYNITEYLFLSTSNNNFGNQMSNRAIRNIVNNIYKRAGLDSNLYVFHSLRHSFCNINLSNNADIVEVSKSMRHKSIQTTMRYVKDIEAKDNKCFATVSDLIFN